MGKLSILRGFSLYTLFVNMNLAKTQLLLDEQRVFSVLVKFCVTTIGACVFRCV